MTTRLDLFSSKAARTICVLLVALLIAIGLDAQNASAQDSARFPPLNVDQLTPEQKMWADSIALPPRNAKFTNPPYAAFIRSPEFAKRVTSLGEYLRWNTSLPPRLSELAILITARHWTAQYEWTAHYALALKGGLNPAIAAYIAAGNRPQDMRDDEAALFDFANELYRDKKVSDAAYKAALAQFGERGIMDIIGIIASTTWCR